MSEKFGYEYYRSIFEGKAKPLAFLDQDLLAENIDAIAGAVGDKLVRIASKSIRNVTVLRDLLNARDQFQGVMCFTAPEALYLADKGFDDLLVAYPTWHAADIEHVAVRVGEGRQITLTVDSEAHLSHIEAIGKSRSVMMPVCLDVDMSSQFPGIYFGVRRSPVKDVAESTRLVRIIADSQYLHLDGVLGYEAQIAGVGDQHPGFDPKDYVIKTLKKRSIKEVAQRREAILDAIQGLGLTPRFVNGGGTGSIASTREESWVTEITVGSGFYAPTLFDYYQDFQYRPAAGYAVEIVRQPLPDIYTCLGGGYMASGAIGADKAPQPFLPPGCELLPLEGAGEVQTPVRYNGPENLSIGDPIFMRHSKAGELCERFDSLYRVSNGAIVDRATTYRGDGRCFL